MVGHRQQHKAALANLPQPQNPSSEGRQHIVRQGLVALTAADPVGLGSPLLARASPAALEGLVRQMVTTTADPASLVEAKPMGLAGLRAAVVMATADLASLVGHLLVTKASPVGLASLQASFQAPKVGPVVQPSLGRVLVAGPARRGALVLTRVLSNGQ